MGQLYTKDIQDFEIFLGFVPPSTRDWPLAQQLANHLKAPCYSLAELKAESLYHTVRQEMANPTPKSAMG